MADKTDDTAPLAPNEWKITATLRKEDWSKWDFDETFTEAEEAAEAVLEKYRACAVKAEAAAGQLILEEIANTAMPMIEPLEEGLSVIISTLDGALDLRFDLSALVMEEVSLSDTEDEGDLKRLRLMLNAIEQTRSELRRALGLPATDPC